MFSKKGFYSKVFCASLAMLMFLNLALGYVSSVNAATTKCEDNTCVEKPKSNVSAETKQQYILNIENSAEFKKYAKKYDLKKVKKDNIIVQETKKDDESIATVSYIMGKKLGEKNNNLAVAEFRYNSQTENVYYNQLLFAKFVTHNGEKYANLQTYIDDTKYYEINIKGDKLYDENFKETTTDKLYDEAVQNIPASEEGWCEWAMAGLCGAGGGAGCFGAAALLGITTGFGGFALATICSLIASLGCTAATKKVCR